MVISIIIGWYIGYHLKPENTGDSKKHQTRWLIAGCSFHIGVLIVFKYLTFIAQQLGYVFNKDFSFIHITLPIGISFFTFQLLSYLFDVYYGKAKPQKNVLNLGLYIALFPQLIAGPIVRYDTIENQINNRKETVDDFTDGMIRFIYGLGKKMLIANFIAQIADNLFSYGLSLSVTTAWLGALAYTFQIYFDFSGYSDMAIGLGKMFGFHFLENFNYPYLCSSATEFWRRWHISLGSWFRDYVYIPLGGNRGTKMQWLRNLFCVWALTGIWHGANWTFLCWGLFYFVLLLIEKTTGFTKKIGFLGHIYGMVAVIIGWVIFRSINLGQALNYIGMMFGIGSSGILDDATFYYLWNGRVVWLLAMVLSFPVVPYFQRIYKGTMVESIVEPIVAFGIFLFSLIMVISSTYNPFIYFNF